MSMQFEIKDLKKLLQSINNNNIDEMSIYSKKFQLTINRSKINSISTFTHKPLNTINKQESLQQESITSKDKLEKNDISNSTIEAYSTILSPMVGTFYRSPAPHEPPFVDLYDIVQKKQTVCIIEAMKLMNEIEAEVHGEVAEILVQDGDIIDCGQALMRIKPVIE